jgi:fucose 4-O-acetylase-like acetyltransferase
MPTETESKASDETERPSPAARPACRSRVEWIDAARGVGIIAVVMAHVINGLVTAGIEPAGDSEIIAIYRFIVSFHMAIFLVLAGMLGRRSVQKPASVFWIEKAADVLYPYLVWSIVQITIQSLFTGYTTNAATWRDVVRIAYDPPMQFWFLYCLLIGYGALFVGLRILRLPATVFALVALAGVIALKLADPSATSLAGRLRDNMFAFALGVWAASWLERWRELPTWALAATAAIGFGWIAWRPLLQGAAFWEVLLTPNVGAAATFAVAELLVRLRCGAPFRFLGQLSMEIYLAHVLAYAGARIVLSRAFGVTSAPVHVVVGTLVGIGAPVALALMVERLRIPFVFRARRPAPLRAAA